MRIRETVFGSGSEKELYTTLHSRWSEDFNLFPNLPFPNIIELDGDEVSPSEWEYLLKTNVDITLCSKGEDRPLLSIEFDGMGHGFSRDGKYIQTHPSSDPHRKLKLDLKLRIAKAVKYPLVILSYEEKNPIGPELTLTVADGIIGQIIAKKRTHELIVESLERKPIESVHPEEVQAELDWIVDSADVQAKFEWNPVARLAAEYEYALSSLSIIKSGKCEPGIYPDLPDLEYRQFLGGPTVESLRARHRAIEEATKIGCRYHVETDKGRFSDTVWLRNITGPGIHPAGLAEDFTKVVVLKRVAAAYGITEEEIFRKSRGK
jgi:hypothetical protein